MQFVYHFIQTLRFIFPPQSGMGGGRAAIDTYRERSRLRLGVQGG